MTINKQLGEKLPQNFLCKNEFVKIEEYPENITDEENEDDTDENSRQIYFSSYGVLRSNVAVPKFINLFTEVGTLVWSINYHDLNIQYGHF